MDRLTHNKNRRAVQSKLRNDLSTGHAKVGRLANGAAITFLAADDISSWRIFTQLWLDIIT